MNTFQLSCFLCVAKHLNFARAAEELNISQPAVSHQIQSLETELNVRLFNRTTHIVSLTDEGRLFLDDAERITVYAENAVKRLTEVSRKQIRIFSIGCQHTALPTAITDVFSKMHEQTPSLRFRFLTAPFFRLIQEIESGNLDAFLDFYVPQKKRKHIHYQKIADCSVCCAVPISHPFAMKKSLNYDDLKTAEHLILCSTTLCPSELSAFELSFINNRPRWEISFCDTPEIISVYLKSGYGVAVFPEILLPDTPIFSRIPLENAPLLSYGLYHKSNQKTDLLKQLLHFLQ